MNERENDDPLRELGERLDKARASSQRPARSEGRESDGAALAVGWRVGLELVIAVAAGSFIGWAVDKGLGTRPWGVVVGFFLGIFAGMVEVYRAMMSMNPGAGRPAAPQKQIDWSDDED
jgi:ATP synthase protein I